MSKGLEPHHRKVVEVFPCIWGRGGYPMLVTIHHSTSAQKLRGSTPSTITVQPCVIDSSACRERDMNSGVTEGVLLST